MRSEMQNDIDLGGMQSKEFFDYTPIETSKTPKELAANLDLGEKKVVDIAAEKGDIISDKKPKKVKKLGKKAAKLEAENRRIEMRLKIKEEIASVKITNDNYQEVSDEIIKKLGIDDEYFQNYVAAKVGLRAQIDRSKKREDYKEGLYKEDDSLGLNDGELSAEDSEWASKICKLIRESRNNSEEIKEFWKEVREVYTEFEKKYNTDRNNFLGNKFGILAQLATEDLIKEVGELLEKNDKIGLKQENTSPDDDVYNKTDLKVNGLPYQIKSCKFTGKSADFIFKNMVTIIEYGEDYSSKFTDQNNRNNGDQDGPNYLKTRMKEKMKEFRRKALPAAKSEKGVFVMIPRGEVRDDNTGKIISLLEDDGKVADVVKQNFFKQFGEKVLKGIDISKYSANVNESNRKKKK